MTISTLISLGDRHTPRASSPSAELQDAQALAELRSQYATALQGASADEYVVWLGATPTQVHWPDWAHQVVRQIHQRGTHPDVVTAWTQAATAAGPDTQWLVWQEVVEVLARSNSRPALRAFAPSSAGRDCSLDVQQESALFLAAWERLLVCTRHVASPRTFAQPSPDLEASATARSGLAPDPMNEATSETYVAKLASVLQDHDVRRKDARELAAQYLACRPATPLDPDLVDHFLDQVVAPAPPFYLRMKKTSSAPYPVTPNDADERARWSLRLAFLRLLATLEPTCVIQMCKSASGSRDLYAWQGVAGAEAPPRHAFIEACLHSQLPHDPIVPRFAAEGLAHNFWCLFREPLLRAIHTLVMGADESVEPEEDLTLTKALIDCFGGANSSYSVGHAEILNRIQNCASATAGQKRRALLLLGDLSAGRGGVAQACWKELASPAQAVPDVDGLAAEMMRGTLDEVRFNEAMKRLDFSAEEKACLQFRRWVLAGNHEELAKLGAERSMHLPNDLARCIYAWCATDYLPGSTAAELPARRHDVFRIIAIETLIRYRQTFQMDIFRPEVEPEVAPLVFISYRNAPKSSGGGSETSLQLIKLLRGARYRVYQDRRVPGGADWSEDILSKLFSARVVVALHSSAYDDSAWCRLERRIARLKQEQGPQTGLYVPLYLDDYQPKQDPNDPLHERARFSPVYARTDSQGLLRDPARICEAINDAIQLRSGKGKALHDADRRLEDSLVATSVLPVAETA